MKKQIVISTMMMLALFANAQRNVTSDIPQLEWELVDQEIDEKLGDLYKDLNDYLSTPTFSCERIMKRFIGEGQEFKAGRYRHAAVRMESNVKAKEKIGNDVCSVFQYVREHALTYYRDNDSDDSYAYNLLIKSIEVIVYYTLPDKDFDIIYVKTVTSKSEYSFKIPVELSKQIVSKQIEEDDNNISHSPSYKIMFGDIKVSLQAD